MIDSARSLLLGLTDLESKGYSFLVVPGGGPFADLVRRQFHEYSISDEAAHWMAILAMEQYAYFLADGDQAILTTKIARCKGVKILLPYQALLEDDEGLEHSWDYTSDSVAALVAKKLDCYLIKATNVDGIMMDGKLLKETNAASLMGVESCIDQGSLKILKGRSCRIFNGTNAEKFIEAIVEGKGGTLIKG